MYQHIEVYSKNLDTKIREGLATLYSNDQSSTVIERDRIKLSDMRQEFQNKIDALETEKQTALNNGTLDSTKRKDFVRRTEQLKKAMNAVTEHIRIIDHGITGSHSPETQRQKYSRR
jgi:chromatin segregation and condensation protein Rec8/ScpA/Scc1 (kleisin family)